MLECVRPRNARSILELAWSQHCMYAVYTPLRALLSMIYFPFVADVDTLTQKQAAMLLKYENLGEVRTTPIYLLKILRIKDTCDQIRAEVGPWSLSCVSCTVFVGVRCHLRCETPKVLPYRLCG